MQNLRRNQSIVYYKNYVKNVEIIDEYGNVTGSYDKEYGDLKRISISVSGNIGTSEYQTFGRSLDYDRTLTTADMSCDIDENSILWLDGADTSKPHNYVVKKRSATINQIQFVVKQVNVQ